MSDVYVNAQADDHQACHANATVKSTKERATKGGNTCARGPGSGARCFAIKVHITRIYHILIERSHQTRLSR